MAEISEAAVEAARLALIDEGGSPGNSLHSWRCEYPDVYGPCSCVKQTAEVLLEAALPHLAPALKAEALREAAEEVHLAVKGTRVDQSWRGMCNWLRDRADRIEATP